MIRLGPITIMRSRELDAYREVVRAAWPIHQFLWFYGENTPFPTELQPLVSLDMALSDALSQVPEE